MAILLQTEVSTTIMDTTNLISKYSNLAIESVIIFIPKLVFAILFYFVGSWLIKKLMLIINKAIKLKEFDISFVKFLNSVIKISLTIFLFISIASIISIPITGFAALLAGAGLAIGGAMNGSLGNLAGGVMMMIFRPFKVGDIIEAQGQTGVVIELGMFSTILLTPDNKTTFIPNGALSTGVISNFKTQGSLRLDLEFVISNRKDYELAKKLILDELAKDVKILKNPETSVSIKNITGGKIVIAVRPYTTQEDYWSVHANAQESISNILIENEIDFPNSNPVFLLKNS